MQKQAGPFQVIDNDGQSDQDTPSTPPERRYDCENYEKCLNLAAALNWDSFSCGGCNGKVNEGLQWRAQKAKREDALVDVICTVPDVTVHHSEWNPAGSLVADARKGFAAKAIIGGLAQKAKDNLTNSHVNPVIGIPSAVNDSAPITAISERVKDTSGTSSESKKPKIFRITPGTNS